jgi:predicted nucleotidyltransferase
VPGILRSRVAAILQEFRDHGVDFILVGGIAAVLEGVDVNTFDLDVVHSRNPDNIARLLAALESLNATYRTRPELALKPDVSHLASPGHQLLMTRFGPLDVLGMIGHSRCYDDLLPHTHELEVGDGLRVRVLDLETLIAVKEEVGGERDLAVLPIMRRTLEEKRRR